MNERVTDWNDVPVAIDEQSDTMLSHEDQRSQAERLRELVEWIESESGPIPDEVRARVAALDWPD